MQIRIQANRIQCIRSEYDPEIKRSRQKVVGSFSRWLTTVPADLIELLDDTEKAELAEFMEAHTAKLDASAAEFAIRHLPVDLRKATEAIAGDDGSQTAEHAANIWEAIAELEAALRAKGFKKPRAKKAAD